MKCLNKLISVSVMLFLLSANIYSNDDEACLEKKSPGIFSSIYNYFWPVPAYIKENAGQYNLIKDGSSEVCANKIEVKAEKNESYFSVSFIGKKWYDEDNYRIYFSNINKRRTSHPGDAFVFEESRTILQNNEVINQQRQVRGIDLPLLRKYGPWVDNKLFSSLGDGKIKLSRPEHPTWDTRSDSPFPPNTTCYYTKAN